MDQKLSLEAAIAEMSKLSQRLKSDRAFSERVHALALEAYKHECSTLEESFVVAFESILVEELRRVEREV